MEVLGVDTGMGIVKLRLMGSCHGCPSSSLTLTQGVEKILRDRWSGFRKLEVEGEEEGDGEPKKLLQIQTLRKG
jgi:Fe-S cluster biogenesis protein NfuA